MLTTILTALCALTLSTVDFTAPADTVNRYYIDGVEIKNFNGSQLNGKAIKTYEIETLNTMNGVVKHHNISTQGGPTTKEEVRIISSGTYTDGMDKDKIIIRKAPGIDGEIIYVIDGRKVTSEEFSALKPSDISSMEILKGNASEVKRKYTVNDDASVILVTTRSEAK